ncbi:hypothetical protein EJ08DRAFT_645292 [Tothia fuscella]|uniref:Uncharacterized protein n=1 Tax=Tothia fuscella TaxID=1048955 RepID=A0A9P4P311_9PEZI|nr:hypothetical protein EJ08DRAFT_645292 [Tothia fuscella]
MFRGDYTSRRKTLIQAWRERWPRPRADKDAVNAWRKAHPAPSETLNPTQRKKEAGNETEAWRVLRLDKIAALEEFLRMEDAALFRERKHKLDKAAGQLVPSK